MICKIGSTGVGYMFLTENGILQKGARSGRYRWHGPVQRSHSYLVLLRTSAPYSGQGRESRAAMATTLSPSRPTGFTWSHCMIFLGVILSFNCFCFCNFPPNRPDWRRMSRKVSISRTAGNRMLHAMLHVKDIDESLNFYQDLGMKVLSCNRRCQ